MRAVAVNINARLMKEKILCGRVRWDQFHFSGVMIIARVDINARSRRQNVGDDDDVYDDYKSWPRSYPLKNNSQERIFYAEICQHLSRYQGADTTAYNGTKRTGRV